MKIILMDALEQVHMCIRSLLEGSTLGYGEIMLSGVLCTVLELPSVAKFSLYVIAFYLLGVYLAVGLATLS